MLFKAVAMLSPAGWFLKMLHEVPQKLRVWVQCMKALCVVVKIVCHRDYTEHVCAMCVAHLVYVYEYLW